MDKNLLLFFASGSSYSTNRQNSRSLLKRHTDIPTNSNPKCSRQPASDENTVFILTRPLTFNLPPAGEAFETCAKRSLVRRHLSSGAIRKGKKSSTFGNRDLPIKPCADHKSLL